MMVVLQRLLSLKVRDSRMFNERSETGNTMVNVLVTLAIISVLATFSLTRLRGEVESTHVGIADTRINAINKIIERYYDAQCPNGALAFVQPTPAILLANGYIANIGIITLPITGIPVMQIENAVTNDVQFVYRALFPSLELAQQAASQSKNASFLGNTVTWRFANSKRDTLEDVEALQFLEAFDNIVQVCG